MSLYVFIIDLEFRYFSLSLFVYVVHVIKLSLLLMSGVLLYFVACRVFYCDVSGRLILLFVINRLIDWLISGLSCMSSTPVEHWELYRPNVRPEMCFDFSYCLKCRRRAVYHSLRSLPNVRLQVGLIKITTCIQNAAVSREQWNKLTCDGSVGLPHRVSSAAATLSHHCRFLSGPPTFQFRCVRCFSLRE